MNFKLSPGSALTKIHDWITNTNLEESLHELHPLFRILLSSEWVNGERTSPMRASGPHTALSILNSNAQIHFCPLILGASGLCSSWGRAGFSHLVRGANPCRQVKIKNLWSAEVTVGKIKLVRWIDYPLSRRYLANIHKQKKLLPTDTGGGGFDPSIPFWGMTEFPHPWIRPWAGNAMVVSSSDSDFHQPSNLSRS